MQITRAQRGVEEATEATLGTAVFFFVDDRPGEQIPPGLSDVVRQSLHQKLSNTSNAYSSWTSSALSARKSGPKYLTRFIALGQVTSMTHIPTQRLASAGGSITSLDGSISIAALAASAAASCSNGYALKWVPSSWFGLYAAV